MPLHIHNNSNGLFRRLGVGISTSLPLIYASYCFYKDVYSTDGSSSRSRLGPTIDDTCRRLRLPTPHQAQKIEPILIRAQQPKGRAHYEGGGGGLLTKAERDAIMTKTSLARSQSQVAYVERNGASGRWQLGGNWRTTYLHSNHFMDSVIDTDNLLERCLCEVEKQAARNDDRGWKTLLPFLYSPPPTATIDPNHPHKHHTDDHDHADATISSRTRDIRQRRRLNFRTMELHEYRKGGALPDKQHYDAGSILTIIVLLKDEFEGGQLYFPIYSSPSDISEKEHQDETNGTNTDNKEEEDEEGTTKSDDVRLLRHEHVHDFGAAGDAIIFPSHKFHNVAQVTNGKRVVLVCEIWDGEKKSCCHRCLSTDEDKKCDYDLEEHKKRQTIGSFALL